MMLRTIFWAGFEGIFAVVFAHSLRALRFKPSPSINATRNQGPEMRRSRQEGQRPGGCGAVLVKTKSHASQHAGLRIRRCPPGANAALDVAEILLEHFDGQTKIVGGGRRTPTRPQPDVRRSAGVGCVPSTSLNGPVGVVSQPLVNRHIVDVQFLDHTDPVANPHADRGLALTSSTRSRRRAPPPVPGPRPCSSAGRASTPRRSESPPRRGRYPPPATVGTVRSLAFQRSPAPGPHNHRHRSRSGDRPVFLA